MPHDCNAASRNLALPVLMSSNALFLGWSRPAAGRERLSRTHFEAFQRFLHQLQAQHRIDTFEMVILDDRPGMMNGFFLIQGDREQLTRLVQGEDWLEHMRRAAEYVDGPGPVWALTDELILRQVGVPAHRVSGPFDVAEAS
jgi:hypothetical protein